MYIIIGRDTQTGTLQLVGGSRSGSYGDAGSVPVSVSPQHCRLEYSKGSIRLRNLDINSFTYVNGVAVESKAVTRTDRIELGTDRYPLDWKAVDTIIPPEADIRPLKKVWDDYEQQNIRLQIQERRFNTIRSATGLITMLAIALSLVMGRQSKWYIVLYAVAIIASVLFFVKAYRDSSKLPQLRNNLSRQFQHDYTCPHCGHNLGSQPYDILAQNHSCPYCRVKFIH